MGRLALSRTDLGLLVGRVGFAGVLILRHGYPKIPALLNHPDRFFDPIGIGPTASLALAAFAEIVCAGLLALGLLGRLPCIPLVLNFAVIYTRRRCRVIVASWRCSIWAPRWCS